MLLRHYRSIPLTVWLMVMVTFISRSGGMVLVFLPLYFAQHLNFSATLIGEALAFYGIGEIAGSYAGGKVADRLGFLITQATALMLAGLSYIALEFFYSYMVISFILCMIGFLNAASRPATNLTISHFSSAETRAQSFALNYQAVNLGAAIGPAIGGILAAFNYLWLFRIDGLTNIIASIVLLIFFHGKPKTIQQHTSANTASPWRDTAFMQFIFLTFLIGLCFFSIINAYPYFLKNNYQLTTDQIGFVLGLNGLLIVILQMPVVNYFKEKNLLHAIGLGGLLIGLGYFILPFYHGYAFALVSITIITLGEMICVPLMFEYAMHLAPMNVRGTYLGITSACQASIPLTLTPILSMSIYHHFGATALWLSLGALGVVAIFYSYSISSQRR